MAVPDNLPGTALPRSGGARGMSYLSFPMMLFVGVFGLVFFGRGVRPSLSDPDTQWHVATGRWIVEHGRVPMADPFSHSMPNAPWTAHEWLSELIMAWLHHGLGWSGLQAMAALCAGAALAMIARFALDRMQPVHALMLVVAAAFASLPHLLARPHILAWPLTVFWMAELIRSVETGRAPRWWIALVMVLWANLHGSFTLGVALAAVLAFEAIVLADRGARIGLLRAWAGFLVLMVLATLATPHGWGGWAFTAHVMGLNTALQVIVEWRPTDFSRFQPLEMWILLIMGMALLGRFRLPWIRVLLVLGLVHMALRHYRYATIMGLLAPILMAGPLGRSMTATSAGPDVAVLDRWFEAAAQPMRRLWALGITSCLLAAAGLAAPGLAHRPADTSRPVAALNAALTAGVTGPVWNFYDFGGFLIEQGIPVYIDGRADMYGDEFVRLTLEASMLTRPDALPALLKRYRIGWTMMPPGIPAVAVLDSMPGWRRVHSDDVAIVHRRTEAPTVP